MCIVPDRFNAPSSFVLILGGTIAASTLTYYWLELPAIGLGRQLVCCFRPHSAAERLPGDGSVRRPLRDLNLLGRGDTLVLATIGRL